MQPAGAAMRFVIFGLGLSSTWGNGQATTWRGLLKALHRAGHAVTFFERDVSYYASTRDLPDPDFCELVLYADWPAALPRARAALAEAEVAMVASFCPDGLAACRLVLDSRTPLRVFYDLDTPVTLAGLAEHGLAVAGGAEYLTPDLVPQFDLYLSFTGGPTLQHLRAAWGARRTAALYCLVDPEVHRPVAPTEAFRCGLGYLATYSADRQPGVEQLFVEPARRRPGERFLLVGALYPPEIAWPANVERLGHLAPAEHPTFYCSNRLTLSVTRRAMAEAGYSPSARLFEAASCGAPILSDWWAGLDELFTPGREILVARTADEVSAALELSDAELAGLARAARERALAEHTPAARARELVAQCEAAVSRDNGRRTADGGAMTRLPVRDQPSTVGRPSPLG